MASEQLLVTVGLSATKFKSEMKKVNDDLKTAEKNFKTTEKTANLMEKGTESLGMKLKALSNVFDAQTKKIESYKGRLSEVTKTNKELEQQNASLQDKLKSVTQQYEVAAREMGESSKEAKALASEIKGLESEIKKNESAMERGNAEYSKLNNALESTQLEADYTKAKMNSLQGEINQVETGGAISELDSLENQLEQTGKEALTLQDRLGAASDKFKNIGNSLKGVGQSLTTSVTLPVVAAGTAFVTVAANAGEMQSKFDTVFKTTAKDVEKWAKDLGNSIGRSSLDLKEAASNSADLMIGMGMTEQKAGDLSKKFIELAYDLGSFNNVNDATAIEAMTKAMMGETEMAKSLGINLSVATMEQSEYVKGLGKKWKDMTQAEKAEAYYAEAVKQSGNAMGDAAKTSESLTNRTRALQGKIKDLSAELGEKLLPFALKLVNAAAAIADKFTALDDRTQIIILTIAGFAAVLGPLLMIIGQVSIGVGALAGMFGALTALSTPVIIAIAAISATFAALAIGINSGTEEVNGSIGNLTSKFEEAKLIITAAFQGLWDTLKSVWDTIGKPLYDVCCELTAILVNTIAELLPVAAEAWRLMTEAFDTVWNTILKPVFEFLMEIVAGVVDFVKEHMPQFVEIFKGAFDSVQHLWNSVLKPVFDILAPVVAGIINAIRPLWETFKNIISIAFNLVYTLWNTTLKPAFDAIVSVVGWVVQGIGPYFSSFVNIITGAMNAVLKPIQWVIDKIDSLLGFISKASSKVSGFLDKINPFKSIEGPVMEAKVITSTNGIEALDFEHQVYSPRTPFSQGIASISSAAKNITSQSDSLLKELIGLTKSNQEQQGTGGITLQIENFNNNRELDIQTLMEEMEYYRRQRVYKGAMA